MNLTDKQKQWLAWTAVALLVGIAGFLGITFPVQVPPTPSGQIGSLALANQGIKCTSGSPATGDCVTIWNGATLSFYSDQGSTRKFYIDSAGNVTALGTFTVTNLVSQTVGVAATSASTLMTTTVGSGGVGTLAVHAPATFTDTVNMSNQIISNIGNAGTDFDTSGGLTAAGGVTATINTANQSSITNLGTQTYLTATNFSLAGITQKWSVGGTAATYTSESSIAFTAPTTPTWCVMSPSPEITATYTITSAGFSVNTITRSNPVYWTCGQ